MRHPVLCTLAVRSKGENGLRLLFFCNRQRTRITAICAKHAQLAQVPVEAAVV